MAIDILHIQPSVVSRDLKGKYVLIYGQAKVGKTSFAAKFKKNLILAFELGTNALDNVLVQPVQKWSDMKLILRQLDTPEAHELYDTITIDTASIAYDLCEQFICSQNSVQKIDEIAWGGGYAAAKKEFESTLRKITLMGYGLILIAHSEVRKEKIGESEKEFFRPALNKRCYEICNRLVDVIGYINIEWDEEGNSHRYLYTRQTPQIMAGSRFKYLAPKIEFGYESLVKAISEALDKQKELDGATIVDTKVGAPVEEKLDFNTVRAEAQELWTKLVGTGDNASEDMARTILKKIEITMSRPMKLSEFTEDQVDLLNLIVLEMRDML